MNPVYLIYWVLFFSWLDVLLTYYQLYLTKIKYGHHLYSLEGNALFREIFIKTQLKPYSVLIVCSIAFAWIGVLYYITLTYFPNSQIYYAISVLLGCYLSLTIFHFYNLDWYYRNKKINDAVQEIIRK